MTYVISRQVRPFGVLLWTAAYYGVYNVAALNWLTCSLQTGLNKVADPFAKKYGVNRAERYLE